MPKTKRSWRDLYIHLLNEGPKAKKGLSDDEITEQRLLVSELIMSGHATGAIERDVNGDVSGFLWTGPTTEGRLLADKLAEEKRLESWSHKLKFAGIAVVAWIAGIVSAWIVWRITK